MRAKKLNLKFYLLLLLISLSSQAYSQIDSSKKASFKIGIINPLSGIFQNYGKECQRGYDLAYSELQPELKDIINFVVEDDQSTPKMAVTALQKLSGDPTLLAATAFSSSVALAVSPISISNKLPLVAVSAHPDFTKNNPYAYSNWLDASYESAKFIAAFKRDQVRRLAIVTFENDYTLAVRTSIIDLAQQEGIEIVFDQKISDPNDHRSLLPKLISQKPDAVLINLIGPSFSQFTKQLFEFNYHGIRYSLNSNARSEYLEAAGIEASNGIIYYGPDYYHPFFLRHLDPNANIAEGHSYTFCCYLGMKLLLNSAEKLTKEEKLSRANLQQEMSQTKAISFSEETIPVQERRIIYNFTESRSELGKIVHFVPAQAQ